MEHRVKKGVLWCSLLIILTLTGCGSSEGVQEAERVQEAEEPEISREEQQEYRKEMEQLGVTDEDIRRMAKWEYTDADVMCLWRELQPEEKLLMAGVIQGTEESFRRAFLTDPNVLTEATWEKLAEYSWRLYWKETEEPEMLRYFTNGMLAAEKQFSEKIPGIEEGGIDTQKMYRDIYLEKMREIMLARLKESTYERAMNGFDETLDEKHELKIALCGYWYVLQQMTSRGGWHEDDQRYAVSSVRGRGDTFIFYSLTYYSPWEGQEEEEHIEVGMISGASMSYHDLNAWDCFKGIIQYSTNQESGVAFTGFYSAGDLRAMKRLSEEGVAAMSGWDEETIQQYEEYLQQRYLTEEEMEMAKQLVYGQFDWREQVEAATESGTTGEELHAYGTFLKVITEIHSAIKEMYPTRELPDNVVNLHDYIWRVKK